MSRRVLFLEVLPVISGGQQVLLELLGGDLPFEAHVLVPGPGLLADALADLGVTVHLARQFGYTLVRKTLADRLRYGVELPRLALRTARLARRLDVDLLYANAARAFLWGTLAAEVARRPILWHVHNMIADRATLEAIRLAGRTPAVRRLVCVCEAARAQYPALRDRARVVYNGVDVGAFRPDQAAGRALRDELGLGERELVLGLVADLTLHKAQDDLLRAASRLPAQVLTAVLIVGPERDNAESREFATRLRELATRLPAHVRAVFTGRRDDMVRIYNALDVLVVASRASETTSLTMQEAMACGRTVVAAATGGIPELVEPGVNGFLYPPGDVDMLAATLGHLARRRALRVEVGQCARQTAAREFDRARMREELLRQIEDAFS